MHPDHPEGSEQGRPQQVHVEDKQRPVGDIDEPSGTVGFDSTVDDDKDKEGSCQPAVGQVEPLEPNLVRKPLNEECKRRNH